MDGLVKFLAIGIVCIFGVADCLKVSIYYEALCGDSVRFITQQLYPHFSEIQDYIDLDFIPYGKAVTLNKNGTYQFLCQHGPQECNANKFQACVLAQINQPLNYVQFVNCIMTRRNSWLFANVENCARRFNFTASKISSCYNSVEGDTLLAQHGDLTWKLEPSLSFVPTIVYDDKFDEVSQRQSLMDFVAVVCNKITGTKPSICATKSLPGTGWWGFD